MSGVNNIEGFHKVLELASTVAGGRDKLAEKPFISIITSFAISPLKLCTASTRIMQEANRQRIPVALSCAPMAGSTAPITMAANLVQIHAEQLAGIVICQLTQPGAPLLYGGIPGRANLNTMGYLGGSVECGMMNAAIHQMARHIGVPNYNSSALTDSKIPDQQAAWEKGMTTLLAAMGGSNFVHHAAGMLESMIAVAYEQYVIDDEIIGMSLQGAEGHRRRPRAPGARGDRRGGARRQFHDPRPHAQAHAHRILHAATASPTARAAPSGSRTVAWMPASEPGRSRGRSSRRPKFPICRRQWTGPCGRSTRRSFTFEYWLLKQS